MNLKQIEDDVELAKKRNVNAWILSVDTLEEWIALTKRQELALSDANLALMEQTELAEKLRQQAEAMQTDRDQARAELDAALASQASKGAWVEQEPVAYMFVIKGDGVRKELAAIDYLAGPREEVISKTSLYATPSPAQVSKCAADLIGLTVSVDVSTCDDDAGHRYFGKVDAVQECPSEKGGIILLVQEPKPNFEPAQAQPVASGTVQSIGPPEFCKYNPEGLEGSGSRADLWAYGQLVGWRIAQIEAQPVADAAPE